MVGPGLGQAFVMLSSFSLCCARRSCRVALCCVAVASGSVGLDWIRLGRAGLDWVDLGLVGATWFGTTSSSKGWQLPPREARQGGMRR